MKTAVRAALVALLIALLTPFALPGAAATPTTQCPDPTVTVTDMSELQAAVDGAQPGDVVVMEPGRYDGRLTIERSGAKTNPIWLCGPRSAVIDGGDVARGRAVHLKDADNWRLVGFTVTNAQKGMTISRVNNSLFADLHVHHIGHEAIHLLSGSTDNVVRDNLIHDTGNTSTMFGEGVYIGAARDNWDERGVDYSNRNQVIGNTIFDTTAESIDIKEGTKDGVIRGNTFDGASNSLQADSWVTVKGQRYLIEDNIGHNAPHHGFESQNIRTDLVEHAGKDNVFRGNVAHHDGDGYAFFTRKLPGVEACDNEVLGTGRFSDLACEESPGPGPTPTRRPRRPSRRRVRHPPRRRKRSRSPHRHLIRRRRAGPRRSRSRTPRRRRRPGRRPPRRDPARMPLPGRLRRRPLRRAAPTTSRTAGRPGRIGCSATAARPTLYIGDWDGDGADSITTRRGRSYYVNNRLGGGDAQRVVPYGRANDVVLVGDWDGDGTDTLAVRRGNSYHIRNSMTGGDADVVVTYGRPGDTVLVGDWDGDGRGTLAVRRGREYHIRNSMTGGDADVVVTYGRRGDDVLVGDWDGDRTDTLAVRRGRVYHVKNSMTGGDADIVQSYGRPTDRVLVGDWDGDHTDTLGVRRHS